MPTLRELIAAAQKKHLTGELLLIACGEDPDRLNNGGLSEAINLLLEEDDADWIMGVITGEWK